MQPCEPRASQPRQEYQMSTRVPSVLCLFFLMFYIFTFTHTYYYATSRGYRTSLGRPSPACLLAFIFSRRRQAQRATPVATSISSSTTYSKPTPLRQQMLVARRRRRRRRSFHPRRRRGLAQQPRGDLYSVGPDGAQQRARAGGEGEEEAVVGHGHAGVPAVLHAGADLLDFVVGFGGFVGLVCCPDQLAAPYHHDTRPSTAYLLPVDHAPPAVDHQPVPPRAQRLAWELAAVGVLDLEAPAGQKLGELAGDLDEPCRCFW